MILGLFSGIILAFVLFTFLWSGFCFATHYLNLLQQGKTPSSPRTYAKAVIREARYNMWINLMASLAWFPPSREPPFRPQGPIILMLHGYGVTRAVFFSLYWRLRRWGYDRLFTLNVRPLVGSLGDMAEHVRHEITRLHQRFPDLPLIIIGHSQGGLVAREALRQDSSLRVDKIIAIGSPHKGTWIAGFGMGASVQEMRPGSAFLNQLGSTSSPCPVVSIYSDLDNVIIPNDSAAFGDVTHEVQEHSHYQLLFSQEVLEIILKELPALRSSDRAQQQL